MLRAALLVVWLLVVWAILAVTFATSDPWLQGPPGYTVPWP